MSSEQQLPKIHEVNSKGAVTGSIEGTLKNLMKNKSYPFSATGGIWRDEQAGTLRFHGQMPDPERLGKHVAIWVQFKSSEQESNTYPVGDPAILGLGYIQYKNEENDGMDVLFKAESGEVVLQREQFQKPVNGQLAFKTATVGDDRYEVDVTYTVGDDF